MVLELLGVRVFRSQSNESDLIDKIIQQNNFSNKKLFFVEFGFGPTEFNCARLSYSGNSGIVIDMDSSNTAIARKMLNKKTKIIEKKLAPQDLRDLVQFKPTNFNVLNIDVDGNDYEFMEFALINFELDLIVTEFNSTFGDMRVKVPFDLNFNRFSNHGFWHGASLKAFVDLAHNYNFCLKNVSSNFVNALFIPSNLTSKLECQQILVESLKNIDLSVRSKKTGITWKEQFEIVKKFPLEYLDATEIGCTAERI